MPIFVQFIISLVIVGVLVLVFVGGQVRRQPDPDVGDQRHAGALHRDDDICVGGRRGGEQLFGLQALRHRSGAIAYFRLRPHLQYRAGWLPRRELGLALVSFDFQLLNRAHQPLAYRGLHFLRTAPLLQRLDGALYTTA
jgi:hypothetical protein